MNDFDRLEEKVSRMVKTVQALKAENLKLKEEIAGLSSSNSEREQERKVIKNKIDALLELVESIEE